MKKGDVMNCVAEVFTSYAHNWHTDEKLHSPNTDNKSELKVLFRRKKESPLQCLLIGKTYIATGNLYLNEYNPAYLVEDKRHSVWKCVPYNETDDRYYKPFFTLEDDLKSRTAL